MSVPMCNFPFESMDDTFTIDKLFIFKSTLAKNGLIQVGAVPVPLLVST